MSSQQATDALSRSSKDRSQLKHETIPPALEAMISDPDVHDINPTTVAERAGVSRWLIYQHGYHLKEIPKAAKQKRKQTVDLRNRPNRPGGTSRERARTQTLIAELNKKDQQLAQQRDEIAKLREQKKSLLHRAGSTDYVFDSPEVVRYRTENEQLTTDLQIANSKITNLKEDIEQLEQSNKARETLIRNLGGKPDHDDPDGQGNPQASPLQPVPELPRMKGQEFWD